VKRKSTKKSSRGRFLLALRSLGRPSWKTALTMAVLATLIGLAGARSWGLYAELRTVSAARAELEDKRAVLERRHAELEDDTRAILEPDNLETELRSRFNYKSPGEKVIVVVPPEDQAR